MLETNKVLAKLTLYQDFASDKNAKFTCNHLKSPCKNVLPFEKVMANFNKFHT